MSNRPKLQDVADLAGVSIGTASHALNNKNTVLPETRTRVLQAATQLGYRLPSRTATPPRRDLSTIGVLVKREEDPARPISSFYSAVLSGAEHECTRHNLRLMYASIEVDDLSQAVNWPPLVGDVAIGGWLIVGAFLRQPLDHVGRHLGPNLVLVDAYAPGAPCDAVVTDNFHGAYTAVRHLIQHGHCQIGLVGSAPGAHPSIRQRRAGYLQALADHGIAQSYIYDSALNSAAGFEATRALLHAAPALTAIFACNDETAMGVISAAYELNRAVPHNLSVIGFDGLDTGAKLIPPLSTIYVDKLYMGAMAVRQLIDRQHNPDRVPLRIALGTRLVERQSVRTLTTSPMRA